MYVMTILEKLILVTFILISIQGCLDHDHSKSGHVVPTISGPLSSFQVDNRGGGDIGYKITAYDDSRTYLVSLYHLNFINYDPSLHFFFVPSPGQQCPQDTSCSNDSSLGFAIDTLMRETCSFELDVTHITDSENNPKGSWRTQTAVVKGEQKEQVVQFVHCEPIIDLLAMDNRIKDLFTAYSH